MEFDYKDYPKSIGEIKSDKSESGRDWTPRDALISLLREIDSGEISPAAIFICGLERDEEGSERGFYRNSAPSVSVTLGTIELSRNKYLRETTTRG